MTDQSDIYQNPSVQQLKSKNVTCLVWILILSLLIVLASGIFIGIILLKLAAYSYDSDNENENNVDKYVVCVRPDCYDAAKILTDSMNITANPCEDFFTFVCGHYGEKYGYGRTGRPTQTRFQQTIAKAHISNDTSTSALVNYSRRYVRLCREYNRNKTKNISAMITDIGGMPLYDVKTYKENFPWWRRLLKLIQKYRNHYQPMFHKSIVFFNILTNNKRIRLITPHDQRDDTPYLFHGGPFINKSESKTYYYHLICEFVKKKCPKSETGFIYNELEKLYKLDTQYREVVLSTNIRTRTNFRIDELGDVFPETPWLEILKAAVGKDLKTDGIVRAVNVPYLNELLKLIRATAPEVLANYFAFHLARSLYPFLNDSERMIAESLPCWAEIKNALLEVHNRVLMEDILKTFSLQDFKNVESMIRYIHKAMMQMIQEKVWLSNHTKGLFLDKLEAMDAAIGFEKWIMNDKSIGKFYNIPLQVIEADTYEKMRDGLDAYIDREMSLENKRRFYKMESFIGQIDELNVFYRIQRNKIALPISMLFPPFYWLNGTKAINYGSLGHTIGHEIAHSSDQDSLSYDDGGNARDDTNAWTKESKKQYDDKVNCLVNQTNYLLADRNVTFSGNSTITETIADNAGIRAAYRGYVLSGPEDERLPGLENYNDKQLFFIARAVTYCNSDIDEVLTEKMKGYHAAPTVRLLLPTVNFEEFAVAFNCPEESRMNRKNERCIIW